MSIGIGAIILTWKKRLRYLFCIFLYFCNIWLLAEKTQNTKIMGTFVCITRIIYAIFVGYISVIINELITLISIAIFYSDSSPKKDKKKKPHQKAQRIKKNNKKQRNALYIGYSVVFYINCQNHLYQTSIPRVGGMES